MKGALSAVARRIPARETAANEPTRRGRSVRQRELKRLVGIVLILSSVFAACPLPLLAQQTLPKPITLAAIVESMEAREKLTNLLSVRWAENRRYRGGALGSKDAEYNFRCEMRLKRDSMRYESKTFWFRGGGNVSVIDHVSTWDGNESRFLQGATPPVGRILAEKGNTDAGSAPLTPLMLYFRPLARLDTEALKLADGSKTIDGHECVTVDDGHFRVYLDCDRNFVPVGFQAYLPDGRVHLDGTLEYYRKHDAVAWVPKAFQIKFHRVAQGVPQSIRGDNVQTAIGAPLKESDFALAFEPGTIVWDGRTREEYRVRDDGSKEPIERPRRRRAPPK